MAKELGSVDDVNSMLVLDSQPCLIMGKRQTYVLHRMKDDPISPGNLLDTLPPELGLSAVNSDDNTGMLSKQMEWSNKPA